mmetsp:Transcript_36829/g.49806  ORF Transcript_36829/g.49806 Transcript_36829/m.49806 type:complete len:172 (-) Transcript_36829:1271-1786(-)
MPRRFLHIQKEATRKLHYLYVDDQSTKPIKVYISSFVTRSNPPLSSLNRSRLHMHHELSDEELSEPLSLSLSSPITWLRILSSLEEISRLRFDFESSLSRFEGRLLDGRIFRLVGARLEAMRAFLRICEFLFCGVVALVDSPSATAAASAFFFFFSSSAARFCFFTSSAFA